MTIGRPMARPIARPIGRRVVRDWGGAPPAFSPATLFTGTDTGFWSSPITPARLWQDTARTNPVTAPGQVAFAWELNTRTGVAYTIVPGGSSGFTYQVDTNGRGYLATDGTNRSMTLLSVTGGPNFQAFAAVNPTSTAATGQIINSDFTGSRRWGQFLYVTGPGGAPGSVAFSGTTPIIDGSAAITVGTNNVISAIARSGIDLDVRTNGVSNGATASGLTYNTTTDNISLGSNPGPNSFFNGRIYGLILRFGPNLTSQQITDTEAWLANLMVP